MSKTYFPNKSSRPQSSPATIKITCADCGCETEVTLAITKTCKVCSEKRAQDAQAKFAADAAKRAQEQAQSKARALAAAQQRADRDMANIHNLSRGQVKDLLASNGYKWVKIEDVAADVDNWELWDSNNVPTDKWDALEAIKAAYFAARIG